MTLYHGSAPTLHDYVVNPMYTVTSAHAAGLAFGILALVVGLLRSYRRAGTGSTPTPPASIALAAVGWAHLGLVFGHEVGLRAAAFAIYGVWAIVAAERSQGRRRNVIVVGLSILAWSLLTLGGETPDQAALLIKLGEVGYLALVLAPREDRAVARLRQSFTVTGAVFVVGVAAWAGAFGDGEHSHDLGEVPSPGIALPDIAPRPPTAAERRAADELYQATVTALAPYADPEVARAAGYRMDDLDRLGGHADNPRFEDDGRTLDPERPETLVYAEEPDGPVLLGAMFQMDEVGVAGPAVGGPLTVWHAHDHVCFSILPPGIAGLQGPFGSCPLGTVTIGLTNEMIHVWTIDGAPNRFGDLPEGWIEREVAAGS